MLTNKVTHSKEHDSISLILYKNTDTLESLKDGLRFLLSRYLENQSSAIAKKVVTQLEKLLQHSDCIGFPNERCSYYRLLNYWRAKSI